MKGKACDIIQAGLAGGGWRNELPAPDGTRGGASSMAVAAVDVHRWTREEYERMATAAFFPPESRVELVEGVVYNMAPQSGAHTTGVHLMAEALRSAFPSCYLRIQSPLALGSRSEPEPDLAIVEGSPRDYRQAHPSTALLVVEVADQSLLHDRGRKLPIYAEAQIPEAWILNLRKRVIEVYREPVNGSYRVRMVLRAGDSISPVVLPESTRPEITLSVADLLP
jgi:Uma2 family endonuclease